MQILMEPNKDNVKKEPENATKDPINRLLGWPSERSEVRSPAHSLTQAALARRTETRSEKLHVILLWKECNPK